MSTRIFALIIGIDNYKAGSIWNLHSCVEDAKNVKHWLTTKLNVPKDQIYLLLDNQASKQNIEDSFMRHLVNNPSIDRGDAILVYFAGHGSTLSAPSDWYERGSKASDVRVLCPYDHDTRSSQGRISGISDRSLLAMVEELASSKGNNISLVLDCCYSPAKSFSSTRCTTTTKAQPDDLYRDLWPGARGKQPLSRLGLFDPDVQSHTLLAACPPAGIAVEDKEGGKFTTAFLKAATEQSLHHTTYEQLIERSRQIVGDSHFLCLGANKDKILFNETPFSTDYRLSPAGWDQDSQLLRVEIGDIHGVIEGTELSLHSHNRLHSYNPAIASAVVFEVRPSSCLVRTKSQTSVVPTACWAKITRWNNRRPFRVHLHSTITSFFRMWKLRRKFSLTPGKTATPTGLNVLRVKKPDMADISLTMHRRSATIVQHNPVLVDEDKRTITMEQTDTPQVVDIAARFNLHLSHTNPQHPLRDTVEMELYTLDPSSWEKVGVNHFLNATATLPYDSSALYQVVLRNHSKMDLWPYVAYLDPNKYSITMLYHPDASYREPPLRQRSTLEIGSGKPGSEALSFSLSDRETHDHGYVKLFLSTEPVDLHILELEPDPHWMNETELDSGGHIDRQKPRSTVWDTILASVVFVRHRQTDGSA